MKIGRAPILALVLLMLGVAALQAQLERQESSARNPPAEDGLLYVQSGKFLERAVLSFDSLIADVYWLRAVQHYGRTKLSKGPNKRYELLYPLLDLTTTLDPRFKAAYRFGAIFLAEQPPAGPGRPDQAIVLLEKGLRAKPDTWEFAEDIGFVHYWWLRDYGSAAEWFTRAAAMPGAPQWLSAMAARTLTEGGNCAGARRLWREVFEQADSSWLRRQAQLRGEQFDALDQIASLEKILQSYKNRTGRRPRFWLELVRSGDLRGVPADPERFPYQLDPESGVVTPSPASPLNPLPASGPC
jgi:tetratricopeptide (TPR) repeat protein